MGSVCVPNLRSTVRTETLGHAKNVGSRRHRTGSVRYDNGSLKGKNHPTFPTLNLRDDRLPPPGGWIGSLPPPQLPRPDSLGLRLGGSVRGALLGELVGLTSKERGSD